jgi:hypothetical protein
VTIITRRRDSDGHTRFSFPLAAELSSPLRRSPKFDQREQTLACARNVEQRVALLNERPPGCWEISNSGTSFTPLSAGSYDQGHIVSLPTAADLLHIAEDFVEDLGS